MIYSISTDILSRLKFLFNLLISLYLNEINWLNTILADQICYLQNNNNKSINLLKTIWRVWKTATRHKTPILCQIVFKLSFNLQASSSSSATSLSTLQAWSTQWILHVFITLSSLDQVFINRSYPHQISMQYIHQICMHQSHLC